MVDISAYRADDAGALLDFVRSLPSEDRNFLKEDPTIPTVIESWSGQQNVNRFVARVSGAVVGYVGVHKLAGWSNHVAELRVVVAPEAREHGIGQRLVRRGLIAAIEARTQKVIVEAVADHDRTIGMLQANGFSAEALLIDHVRDRAGKLRDLMLMTCRVDQVVDDLALVGIDDALTAVTES